MALLNPDILEDQIAYRMGEGIYAPKKPTAPAPEPVRAEVKGQPEPDTLPGNEEPFYVVQDEAEGVTLPTIIDASKFLTEKYTRPAELIGGLLHQGTKMVIGGGSKSFKTWVQLDVAISVAHGIPWLHLPCVQGRVLYVNFEIHPVFFQDRIRAVTAARQLPQVAPGALHVWNLRGFAAAHTLIVPQIIQRIKDEGYMLVVIDPIYKLYGKTDENSAAEVADLMNSLERICVETKAAVLFGAHYSKGNQSGKEAMDRISGSGVFARDPDSIVPFTLHEEDGCFTVEPILRNLHPVAPFVVRWKFPLMTIADDLDPTKLRQQNKGRKREYDPTELLAYIRENIASHPITISDWALKAKIKRQTLAGYLPELRGLGLIATQGAGTSAMQYLTEKGIQFIDNQDDKKVRGA